MSATRVRLLLLLLLVASGVVASASASTEGYRVTHPVDSLTVVGTVTQRAAQLRGLGALGIYPTFYEIIKASAAEAPTATYRAQLAAAGTFRVVFVGCLPSGTIRIFSSTNAAASATYTAPSPPATSCSIDAVEIFGAVALTTAHDRITLQLNASLDAGARLSLNHIDIGPVAAAAATPYAGVVQTIPGNIEIEAYDIGPAGDSFACFATAQPAARNATTTLRPTNRFALVDIHGARTAMQLLPGDFANYTVNVTTTGVYTMSIVGYAWHHIAVQLGGRPEVVPAHGFLDAWDAAAGTDTFPLIAGVHQLRVFSTEAQYTSSYDQYADLLDKITFTLVAAQATAFDLAPRTVLPASLGTDNVDLPATQATEVTLANSGNATTGRYASYSSDVSTDLDGRPYFVDVPRERIVWRVRVAAAATFNFTLEVLRGAGAVGFSATMELAGTTLTGYAAAAPYLPDAETPYNLTAWTMAIAAGDYTVAVEANSEGDGIYGFHVAAVAPPRVSFFASGAPRVAGVAAVNISAAHFDKATARNTTYVAVGAAATVGTLASYRTDVAATDAQFSQSRRLGQVKLVDVSSNERVEWRMELTAAALAGYRRRPNGTPLFVTLRCPQPISGGFSVRVCLGCGTTTSDLVATVVNDGRPATVGLSCAFQPTADSWRWARMTLAGWQLPTTPGTYPLSLEIIAPNVNIELSNVLLDTATGRYGDVSLPLVHNASNVTALLNVTACVQWDTHSSTNTDPGYVFQNRGNATFRQLPLRIAYDGATGVPIWIPTFTHETIKFRYGAGDDGGYLNVSNASVGRYTVLFTGRVAPTPDPLTQFHLVLSWTWAADHPAPSDASREMVPCAFTGTGWMDDAAVCVLNFHPNASQEDGQHMFELSINGPQTTVRGIAALRFAYAGAVGGAEPFFGARLLTRHGLLGSEADHATVAGAAPRYTLNLEASGIYDIWLSLIVSCHVRHDTFNLDATVAGVALRTAFRADDFWFDNVGHDCHFSHRVRIGRSVPLAAGANVLAFDTRLAAFLTPTRVIVDPTPATFSAAASCWERVPLSRLCSTRSAAGTADCDFQGDAAGWFGSRSVASATTPACAIRTNGTSFLDLVPPAAGVFAALALEMGRDAAATRATATIPSGVHAVGAAFSNGRVELRVLATGLRLVQIDIVPPRELAYVRLGGTASLVVGGTSITLRGAAGNTREWPGANSIRLVECTAYLVRPDGSLDIDFLTQHGATSGGNATACIASQGKFQNGVYVHYADGGVVRAGSLLQSTGADLLFVPHGLSDAEAHNYSTCRTGVRANYTTFLAAFLVPFNATRAVTKVRLWSYDTTRAPVVVSAAWYRRTAAGAVCPAIPAMPVNKSTVHVVHGAVVDRADTRGADGTDGWVYRRGTCAARCVGCAAEQVTSRPDTHGALKPPFFCARQAKLVQGVANAAGDYSSSVYVNPTEPSIQRYTTTMTHPLPAARGAFTETAGWTKLFVPSSFGAIQVTRTTAVAVLVPRTAFATSDDWITLQAPSVLQQCGGGFNPFSDARLIGPQPAACAEAGYVVCGESYYEASVEGTVSVWGPDAVTKGSTCGVPFHSMLLVRGTVAAPATHAYIAFFGALLVAPPTALGPALLEFTHFHSQPAMRVDAALFAAAPRSVYPMTDFVCVFDDIVGYIAVDDTTVEGACRTPFGIASITELASLCDTDPSCVGFVTRRVVGSNAEAPGCLVHGTGDAARLTPQANASYFRRRAESSRTCTITTHYDFAAVEITAYQTDFASLNHTAHVLVNGSIVASCGGAQGFDGEPGLAGRCDAKRTCVARPEPLPAGTLVQIVIPGSVSSGGVCAHAAEFHIAFTPAKGPMGHVVAMASRALRFSATAAASTTLLMNPTSLALLAPYSGCATCAPPLAVRVGAARRQSTLVLQCGGTAATGAAAGANLTCGDTVLCTAAAGATPSAGNAPPQLTPTADASTARVTIVYTPQAHPTGSTLSGYCNSSTVVAKLLYTGSAAPTPAGGPRLRTYLIDGSTTSASSVRARVAAAVPAVARGDVDTFPIVPLVYTSGDGTGGQTHRTVPYDVLSVAEPSKTRTALANTNGTFACIVDSFSDAASRPSCRIPVDGATFLVVRVAQTMFADTAASVTITVGDRFASCGAGRSFRGVTATTDPRCATGASHATCYHGPVPAGVTEATLTWTPPRTATPCFPAAVAIAQTDAAPPTLACAATQLACPALNRCVNESSLCDGIIDCPDSQDEAFCHGWTLVGENQAPACATNATMPAPANGVIGFDDCKRWAIANSNRSGASVSLVFVENTLCVSFTCLDTVVPQRSLVAFSYPSPNPPQLYTPLENVDDFRFCTAALHCSSRGTPSRTAPPCNCVCEQGFLGDRCDVQRTMDVVNGVTLVLSGASLSAEAASAITATLALIAGYDVTIAATRTVGSRLAVQITATSAAATAQQLTTAMRAMLTPDARTAVVDALANLAEGPIAVDEITADDVFAQTTRGIALVRVDNSGAVSSMQLDVPVAGTSSQATATVDVRATATITALSLTFLGVSFTASHMQQGRCDSVVEDVDNSATAACQARTVCAMHLAPLLPAVKSSSSSTSGFLEPSSISVNISGLTASGGCPTGVPGGTNANDVVPFEFEWTYSTRIGGDSSTATGDPVTVEARPDGGAFAAVVACIVLAVVALGCLAVVALTLRAGNVSDESRRLARGAMLNRSCVCGSVAYALLCCAVIVAGVAAAAFAATPSHHLVIDEFRSNHCARSEITLVPSRTTRVGADGVCHAATSLGATEGAEFIKARCALSSDGTGSFTGTMEFGVGDTVEACNSAAWLTVRRGDCINETLIFPSKAALEQQFVAVDCFTKAQADARFAFIESSLSSLPQPQTLVTPAVTLPATWATHIGLTTLYTRTTPVSLPTLQRSGSSPALAAFPNSEVESTVRVLGMAGVQADTVAYTDSVTNVTEGPTKAGNASSDLSATGFVFGGLGTSAEVSGFDTASSAIRYQGIEGTKLDVGLSLAALDKDVTITFWMKASSTTRGFPFIVTDYWHTQDTFASPIVERLINIIESGRTANAYFEEMWHAYYGLYVSGRSKTLTFIYARPGNANSSNNETSDGSGGLVQLTFDTTTPSMQVERLFDGNWHFVSLVVSSYGARRYVQLYADGETSFTAEGWRQCFPTQLESVPQVQSLPPEVPIFSTATETTRTRGVAYLGHFNGGVYNFEVHDGFLEQERIIGFGAGGMKRFALISVPQAQALAYSLVAVFVLGAAATVALLGRALKGIAAGDKKVAKAAAKEGGKSAAGAHAAAEALTSATSDEGASQAKNFVPLVLRVAQSMALYITGWRWPLQYEVGWAYIAIPLSLNFNVLPVNAFIAPGLQFAAASVLVILLVYVSQKDKGRFEQTALRRYQMRLAGIEREDGDGWPRPDPATAPEFACTFTLKRHVTAAAASIPHDDEGVSHLEVEAPHVAEMEAAIRAALEACRRSSNAVSLCAPGPITITAVPDQPKAKPPKPPVPALPVDTVDATALDAEALAKHREARAAAEAEREEQVDKRAREDAEARQKALADQKPPVTITGRIVLQSKAQAAHADEPPRSTEEEQQSLKPEDLKLTAYFVADAKPRCNGADNEDDDIDPESCTDVYTIAASVQWPNICPTHHTPLIRAVPQMHPKITIDGVSPYACAMRNRQWYAVVGDTKKHACTGIELDAKFFVCSDDACAFSVCRSCAEQLGFMSLLRSKIYAAKRTGALGLAGLLIVTLSLLIFLPVMRTAVMVLVCHPEWQCEFPECYKDFSGMFLTSFVFSVVIVAVFGFAFLAYLLVLFHGRKTTIVASGVFNGRYLLPNGDVDPEYRPEGFFATVFAAVPRDEWQALLEHDQTMLAALYSPYSFRAMCFIGPADLVFKLALICPIVLVAPNTLEQIAGASAVETIQLVFFLVTNSFTNHWLNALAQVGGLHQVIQLAFMSLHRVAVNQNPDAEGFAWYMVAASVLYAVIMAVILGKVVGAPALRDFLTGRKGLKAKQLKADVAALSGHRYEAEAHGDSVEQPTLNDEHNATADDDDDDEPPHTPREASRGAASAIGIESVEIESVCDAAVSPAPRAA